MRRLLRIGSVGVAAAAVTLGGATAAVGEVGEPGKYGKDDAGGFLNVLPPGSDGVANATDFGRFLADGSLPRHWADQQPLYEGLLQSSPGLTDAQIPEYFKDATFGVRAGDVESRRSPREGVTIIRDKGYGAPHIYGRTRSDTMFGAGYAGAADRLFLMDVLRHTGRADLSSFLGGASLGSDEQQWRYAPYTESDLRRQLDLAKELNGKAGRRAVRDLRAYAAGVNAYIGEARDDPELMPVEYGLLGKQVRNWKATDVIATASLFGGIFGRGGGGELRAAAVLRALESRFGRKEGRRIWSGFRARNDPEAPTVVDERFNYMNRDPFSPKGLAVPKTGSVKPVATITKRTGAVAAASLRPAGRPADQGAGYSGWVRESLGGAAASNWELVSRRGSSTGRPLAVMGPQVGYFLPQILLEMDLHGPGIDARGVAFAGVNLYVQMGHGRDYAWSATSAGSDNVDVFAEVLCGKDRYHYRYKGKCRKMQRLTRRVSWQPSAIDNTPAGSATLTSFRTVHGIVDAFGKVGGRKVAFATARTTYMHEADSVIGFARLNDPGFVKGAKSFQRAASAITVTFNWAYADDRKTAYYLSGDYPRDARGTSPDLPVLGTGPYDWRGYDPKTRTADMVGSKRHPQAVDPDVLVSWNNKPAPGWSAADDQWGYGPVYRSQLIEDRIEDDLRRKGKMRPSDLVRAMEEPATQDIRGVTLLPLLFRAIGTPNEPALVDALTTLRDWQQSGAHRRDLDQDGAYDNNEAVQLMDAWWPLLVESQFRPALGKRAYESLQAMIGIGAVTGGSPQAPGFADGWWGYVSKDLRALFRPGSVSGKPPRTFCGKGSRSRCRQDVRDSLRRALSVTPEQLYGRDACAENPQASCFDANRPRLTAAITKPGAFPFQNRPTFQQVVSVGHSFTAQ